MVTFMRKFYSFNLKYSVVLHNINCTFHIIRTQHYFYQNCRVTFGNAFTNFYVQDITLRKGFHKLRHNLRVLRVFRKCLLKEWPGLKFCLKNYFVSIPKVCDIFKEYRPKNLEEDVRTLNIKLGISKHGKVSIYEYCNYVKCINRLQ